MPTKNWIKRTCAQLAHKVGYTVVPNWQVDTFRTADYLRRLFQLLRIDTVIDVGANAGQYHEFLRSEVGFEGLVASFEPVPELARKLKAKGAGGGKWIVENCALGAERSQLDFHVMSNTEFSSFLSPLNDRTSTFGGANAVVETVKVDVRVLDDVVAELKAQHGAKNIYLKLDTQGYDLEVLRGAKNALDSIPALQSEMCVRPIYVGMPRYGEVITYLESRGFAMSGIYPNNGGHFPLLLEFDCFMLREPSTSSHNRL